MNEEKGRRWDGELELWENAPTRNFLRQGRRRAFHLNHILRSGLIGFKDII
jgi:hypothetical protein